MRLRLHYFDEQRNEFFYMTLDRSLLWKLPFSKQYKIEKGAWQLPISITETILFELNENYFIDKNSRVSIIENGRTLIIFNY